MSHLIFQSLDSTVPIYVVEQHGLAAFLEQQDPRWSKWVAQVSFSAKVGQVALVPSREGELEACLLGVGEREDLWSFGALPSQLPAGTYRAAQPVDLKREKQRALAWALACYRFDAYRAYPPNQARLCVVPEVDADALNALISSIYLVRDLVNTPMEDLGPEQLSAAVAAVAEEVGADYREIVGKQLLEENFPLVYHVGKGSEACPRIAEMTWGDPNAPLLALVGKGVCFDSGGLQIKTTKGMLDMKKDMGGAAHALALARLVIKANLPLRLRLVIPCVENAVSGSAYRPGDILGSRDGSRVEITNTDAEGRLILADALTRQVEDTPHLLIDFATLTGAARVALGPDIAAVMSNDESLLAEAVEAGKNTVDPIWPLPLYPYYNTYMESTFADIVNASSQPYGGAITAGLFLQRFVPDHVPWLHFDLMAANLSDRPARPKGGEAQALRAMLYLCKQRFGVSNQMCNDQ